MRINVYNRKNFTPYCRFQSSLHVLTISMHKFWKETLLNWKSTADLADTCTPLCKSKFSGHYASNPTTPPAILSRPATVPRTATFSNLYLPKGLPRGSCGEVLTVRYAHVIQQDTTLSIQLCPNGIIAMISNETAPYNLFPAQNNSDGNHTARHAHQILHEANAMLVPFDWMDYVWWWLIFWRRSRGGWKIRRRRRVSLM